MKRVDGRFQSVELAARFTCPFEDAELKAYADGLFADAAKLSPDDLDALRRTRELSPASWAGLEPGTPAAARNITSYDVKTDGAFGPAARKAPFAAAVLENLTVSVEVYPRNAPLVGPDGKLSEKADYAFLALPTGPRAYEVRFTRDGVGVYRSMDANSRLWRIKPGFTSLYDLRGCQVAIRVSPLDEDEYDVGTRDGDRFWKAIDAVRFDAPAVIVNGIRIELGNFPQVYEGQVNGNYGRVYQLPDDEGQLLGLVPVPPTTAPAQGP